MKLKCFLLASTMCVLPFAAHAKDPQQPAPVPFTWTGFYVGGTVGGIGVSSDATFNDTRSGFYYGNMDGDGSSVIGGFTAGYNYEFNSIVVGVEGDYSFASVSRNTNSVSTYGYSLDGTSHLENFSTIRGRVGYAFDRMLFYATGGVAFADVKGSSNFYEPANSGCTASFSENKTGWTLGGGAEYLCTNNISIKVEALFADLGSTTAVSPHRCTTTFKDTATIGRLGMNYKF
jgi:outer membrane immunogenic protein